ncbi:MAG: hypothetical protein FJY85_25845, partial [Deltaproteobacteria bacterium]|nr:hypothetical protein [Deltaproteobacteria bacterium]
MKGILRAIGPCLVLPPFLFVMLHYPVVEDEVCQRAPLIVAHDLARQLEAQTAYVESLNKDLPAPYRCILADYKRLLSAEEFVGLRELSTPKQSFSLAEKALAAFILWRRNLPQDFLTADPVGETMDRITAIGMKEERSELRRADIVFRHVLDCLKQTPPPSVPSAGTRNRLPPDIEKNGLLFCGDRVPLDREDVRRRIESQVDYLLNDMRETLAVWLKRKDRYGKAVEMILVQEGVPAEFAILPALESGYDGSAASPSMAGGWWQFLKPTAVRSRSGDRELDWSLQVNQLKD